MGRVGLLVAGGVAMVIAAVAVAQDVPADQVRRLEDAKAQSAAAAARSAALEARAAREKDEAAQARVQEAAVESLAARPAMISLVQPGSVDDLVHVRAVLASAMPVVRARTAALRTDLDRTRALQASAALAATALAESRTRLETQRLALTRL